MLCHLKQAFEISDLLLTKQKIRFWIWPQIPWRHYNACDPMTGHILYWLTFYQHVFLCLDCLDQLSQFYSFICQACSDVAIRHYLVPTWPFQRDVVMIGWHGHTYHIIAHLWVDSTLVTIGFPSQRASNAELGCIVSLNKPCKHKQCLIARVTCLIVWTLNEGSGVLFRHRGIY